MHCACSVQEIPEPGTSDEALSSPTIMTGSVNVEGGGGDGARGMDVVGHDKMAAAFSHTFMME